MNLTLLKGDEMSKPKKEKAKKNKKKKLVKDALKVVIKLLGS